MIQYSLSTESNRTNLISRINLLKLAAGWVVTIKKQRKPRTVDQNSLLWLWLSCLEADGETGYTKEEFYAFFLTEFPTYRVILEKQVQITSSQFDVKEMSRFLDCIQIWAATELGIELPDPQDLRFEQFLESYG